MCSPLFFLRDRHTSPTTQISLPPGGQSAVYPLPHNVQAVEELFIVFDVTELPAEPRDIA